MEPPYGTIIPKVNNKDNNSTRTIPHHYGDKDDEELTFQQIILNDIKQRNKKKLSYKPKAMEKNIEEEEELLKNISLAFFPSYQKQSNEMTEVFYHKKPREEEKKKIKEPRNLFITLN